MTETEMLQEFILRITDNWIMLIGIWFVGCAIILLFTFLRPLYTLKKSNQIVFYSKFEMRNYFRDMTIFAIFWPFTIILLILYYLVFGILDTVKSGVSYVEEVLINTYFPAKEDVEENVVSVDPNKLVINGETWVKKELVDVEKQGSLLFSKIENCDKILKRAHFHYSYNAKKWETNSTTPVDGETIEAENFEDMTHFLEKPFEQYQVIGKDRWDEARNAPKDALSVEFALILYKVVIATGNYTWSHSKGGWVNVGPNVNTDSVSYYPSELPFTHFKMTS